MSDMEDGQEARARANLSIDGGITLGRYMKGITVIYSILVIGLVAVELVSIRGAAAEGNLQPMTLSNLHVVGIAVGAASFLVLALGFGYVFLQLANTTFSSWGIRRPSWLGGLAVPWSAITRVTPFSRGLRFHTEGKTVLFQFRMFDSLPPELLDLLSAHVPPPALAGLYPER
jgi:hypothetical protein